MPTSAQGRENGMALIGWKHSQQITITPAQTELIRQLLASGSALHAAAG